MILALLVFAAALLVLVLPGSLSSIDGPKRPWVIVLRSGAAVLLAVLAADPRWQWQSRREAAVEVVVWVDRSASMSLADPRPRSAWADEILAQLLAAPGERQLRVMESATLDRTELELKGVASNGMCRALVLISDGAFNSGRPPERVAAELGLPVHCVVVGSESGPADRRIIELLAPKSVLPGTPFTLRVEIESTLSSPLPAQLAVHWGDSLLGTEAVGARQSVPVDLPGLPGGVHLLRVELSHDETELITTNNTRHVAVRVLDEPLPVLVIAAAPSPDAAALLRTLRGDRALALRSIVRTADQEALREGFDDPASSLPAAADLSGHEVIFLLGPTHDPGLEEALLEWVIADGGGLVAWNAESAALAKVLPIRSSSEQVEVSSPPDARLDHAALGGGAIARDDWQRLPPLDMPGQTYLVGGEVVIGTPESPVLALTDLGRGRLAALQGSGTWRWSLDSARTARNTHDLFWSALIQWAAGRARAQPFALALVDRSPLAGDSLSIQGSILAEQLSAAAQLKILDSEGMMVAQQELWAGAGGELRTTLPGLAAGAYRLVAAWAEAPPDTSAFVVLPRELEMAHPQARPDLLARVARATDALLATPGELGRLTAALPSGKLTTLQRHTFRPGRSLWLLLLLAALLGGEWWLRRRSGLP